MTGYSLTFGPVLERWPLLLDGLALTIALTLVGMVFGTGAGLVLALARRSAHWSLRWLARLYVEIFRNTPLLVQLFIVYLGLPALGIRFSPVAAACVSLVLNNAAYTGEIIRAGLAATPRGQVEAARSLALRPWQILAFIVLPPALARVYPALVSQNVLLMLSTGITSAIGAQELTAVVSDINSDTFRSIEVFSVAAGLYLLLNYLQRLLLWLLGLRLFRGSRVWA
ncbi:amino acid ABC transporter permease [Bosea sp. SSUT16]|jgi:polar amino acid transport system permease protein|uniref:Amino acid ABC transporter permease n=1 Tax=Bosea spartocytisi TaxID=2773451 RepID=A0A927E503_9HYPH|nr:amino acid ABC transporter permease [Bosea spartocytisi]MBD3844464.1 amino acid ABC transporter permease [Bosea spartocytisi]MCT4470430.1 amino acid ABC transporter permease [Bosea spartocytisi]